MKQRGKLGKQRSMSRQIGENTVTKFHSMLLLVMVQKFALHPGHVHPRWAFPGAGFTTHTKPHRLIHGFGGEGTCPELS